MTPKKQPHEAMTLTTGGKKYRLFMRPQAACEEVEIMGKQQQKDIKACSSLMGLNDPHVFSLCMPA